MRLARRLVVRFERVEIGGQRRFRVDDHVLAAGEVDHEVGDEQRAVPVARGRLLAKVAVGQHPGQLHDALQLDLSPTTADMRRTERGAEVAGLGAQPLLTLRECAHLLGERTVGPLTLLVERLGLVVERLQRRRDRLELRLRKPEERVRVLAECLGRK